MDWDFFYATATNEKEDKEFIFYINWSLPVKKAASAVSLILSILGDHLFSKLKHRDFLENLRGHLWCKNFESYGDEYRRKPEIPMVWMSDIVRIIITSLSVFEFPKDPIE